MGAQGPREVAVTLVSVPARDESVQLDPDRVRDLYRQRDDAAAQEVICRAVGEVATRLARCEQLWRRGDRDRLSKCARSLIAISDQLGMGKLAHVAGVVANAADCGDDATLAATLFRLIRVGDKSLAAVWSLQGLSL